MNERKRRTVLKRAIDHSLFSETVSHSETATPAAQYAENNAAKITFLLDPVIAGYTGLYVCLFN